MNEDFVPYEIVLKLEKKGYKGKTIRYHGHIYDVLKWLREEKKIHIGISPQWQYTVYDMRYNPWIGRSDMQNYNDCTKATLAGIEYCLDYLI